MIERLYDLVVSRPDAMRLNEFILSWDQALENSRVTFLKSIRSLDLSDYANMQALILEAEGDPVGDYIIDLFDMHLHNVLEGDDELERTANEINNIEWAEYPPAQFMPSPEVIEIMDGAIFYNKVRTGIENEGHAEFSNARLGDVFLGPEPPPQAAITESAPAASARHAYVVISQACDLLHGNADRLLLLKGRLLPYSWKQHALKAQPRTPIMIHNDNRYAIEWDVLSPETWELNDLASKKEAGFTFSRRFRTPFALQLQQAFIGRLGRVGTLAALPSHYTAGLRFYLKDKAGNALLLVEASAEQNKAACLVGRTEKNALKEWLLLEESLYIAFRQALRDVHDDNLPTGTPSLKTLRNDPAFLRRFKKGLPINREAKRWKPFQGTDHDVVQILEQKTLENGAPVDRTFNNLIIEIDFD